MAEPARSTVWTPTIATSGEIQRPRERGVRLPDPELTLSHWRSSIGVCPDDQGSLAVPGLAICLASFRAAAMPTCTKLVH